MTATVSEKREQIVSLEKKLLKAFCEYDVATLDELIHEQALFVLPNAQTISKPTVLDNYRNKKMEMEITPSDHTITFVEDTAVISVNLESHVKSGETTNQSKFRYLRVWKSFNGSWKIIATGGVPIK